VRFKIILLMAVLIFVSCGGDFVLDVHEKQWEGAEEIGKAGEDESG